MKAALAAKREPSANISPLAETIVNGTDQTGQPSDAITSNGLNGVAKLDTDMTSDTNMQEDKSQPAEVLRDDNT